MQSNGPVGTSQRSWIAKKTTGSTLITAAIPGVFESYATFNERDEIMTVAHGRAVTDQALDTICLDQTPTEPNPGPLMPQGHLISRAAGIARSLITYYGPVWRHRRIEAFYRQFLRAGDLAFDIGAHVGNRVAVFRRIGAHVVAVEPQPDFVAVLRVLYGRDPDVTIRGCGVAAESGQANLHLSTRTPTVSTFADSWMNDVRADRRFQRIRWDTMISVPIVTLDELITQHGEPQFCKIDVEGFEQEVLSGLSQPIPTLSFEYIPVAVGRAITCVERISTLGHYRYRHSRVETHRWAGPNRLERDAMIKILRALPANDRSGDVYAVRSDQLLRFQEADGKAG
ncbi:MAG TPA: FkbM family methyltransferase [Propionibacteriaceae bacterium]|nr:FkbM family methyltransferase [Propionibacteriaceae bacterium]